MSNSSAVLFLVFNRPHMTARAFDAIRASQPYKLYVAADGARPDREGEAALCDRVREIATQVNWPCELHTLFRQDNLGCKLSPLGAIDWFFQNEEEGIVLEDDCVPHPDFFPFCSEMLIRYREHESVWAVSGSNFQQGKKRGPGSYYFSRYMHCWGWASWRRAWQHNDSTLEFWPEWKNSEAWRIFFEDPLERHYWSDIFEKLYRDEIDTWDYAWLASIFWRSGLTIIPNVNLVSNIGFGTEATHTATKSPFSNMAVHALGDLNHPSPVTRCQEADRYTFEYHYFRRKWLPLRRLFLSASRSVGRI